MGGSRYSTISRPIRRSARSSGRSTKGIASSPRSRRPDPANRCAALRDPVPQSLRQQELVCLASGHVNCPRYLRGAVVVAEAPDPVIRTDRSMSPAVLISLLVLVMAASASVAFVMARGGLEMAVAAELTRPAASATAVAAASVAPEPTTASTPAATPAPTASPTPPRRRRRRRRPARHPGRPPRRHRPRRRPPSRPRDRPRPPIDTPCCERAPGRQVAGSIGFEPATTCTASRTTSGSRSTASTTATRGREPRVCAPARSCGCRHRPASSGRPGRPARRQQRSN